MTSSFVQIRSSEHESKPINPENLLCKNRGNIMMDLISLLTNKFFKTLGFNFETIPKKGFFCNAFSIISSKSLWVNVRKGVI